MSQPTSEGIPIRKVYLKHLSDLPHEYATTPGGTMFSTTPGGTRIIYDRSFLLKCRSSPLSNTPPSNLPDIPGVTSPEKNPNKVDGKITEEGSAQVGKENGGKLPQGVMMSSFIASPFGYDAFANAKSPLQQYRQRNFIQQNTGFYEKVCRDMNEGPAASNGFVSRGVGLIPSAPCSPIVPMQQPACINPHNAYVGDGSWQETYDMVATPAVRKSCPTSQLSLWRQNKMNQTGQQPPIMPANSGVQIPQTNVFPPGHPGLSLYRGVGRGYLHTLWPDTLCDPLEKLFKVQSGAPFVPGQAVPYTTFTPAYGQIDYHREAGMQCDNASIMQ